MTSGPGFLSRRTLLAGAAAVVAAATAGRQTAAADEPRIVSLDYGLANTAMALGVTPVGIAAADGWDRFVQEPPLPDSVVDLGMDRLINMERLAALEPDLILATPYTQALRSRLSEIAPVLSLTLYAPDGEPLDRSYAATRELGERIDRADAARAYLAEADATFAACRERIAAAAPGPVVLVHLMDPRHARVYGAHALFQNVLDRIGLENGWPHPTNYWGFQTIGIEELAKADPESTIVVVRPFYEDEIEPILARSQLWNRLPAIAAGRTITLPAVLAYGAVPSAVRFAALITDAMTTVSR